MSARLPAAVLWDLDGTLVDSEAYWVLEERALVEDFGGVWTEADAFALVGRALTDSAAYIKDHSPVDLPIDELVDRLVTGVVRRIRAEVPWRPGARELLTALREAGVPTALVTMSYRPITDAVGDALPGGAFDLIVSGEDVTHGKPHPEPYLMGAAGLGLAPDECIAIEDSEPGARSAAATGDWRPRASRLCDWCDHKSLCPEWGGTPPPLPTDAPARALDPAVTGRVEPADD